MILYLFFHIQIMLLFVRVDIVPILHFFLGQIVDVSSRPKFFETWNEWNGGWKRFRLCSNIFRRYNDLRLQCGRHWNYKNLYSSKIEWMNFCSINSHILLAVYLYNVYNVQNSPLQQSASYNISTSWSFQCNCNAKFLLLINCFINIVMSCSEI